MSNEPDQPAAAAERLAQAVLHITQLYEARSELFTNNEDLISHIYHEAIAALRDYEAATAAPKP
jgi:hypothetical protein